MFPYVALAISAAVLVVVLAGLGWLAYDRSRKSRLPSLHEIRAARIQQQQRERLRARHQAAHDALVKELDKKD